jgi:hypothetical protein
MCSWSAVIASACSAFLPRAGGPVPGRTRRGHPGADRASAGARHGPRHQKLSWFKDVQDRIHELLDRVIAHLITSMDEIHGERSQISRICADPKYARDLSAAVLERIRSGAGPVELPKQYRVVRKSRSRRRPNAVPTIIDQGALPEGTPLTLFTWIPAEEEALRDWLAADPKGSRATWVNSRGKPILWEVDGRSYSPTGLITTMWELAGWENRPVSNQGAARWMTPYGETLNWLAKRLLDALEEEAPDDEGDAVPTTSD